MKTTITTKWYYYKLVETREGQNLREPPGSMQAVADADLVISEDGNVYKSRQMRIDMSDG